MLAAVAGTVVACAPHKPGAARASDAVPSVNDSWERLESVAIPPPRLYVVLVTLDGVRWQEVLHGVDRDLARKQSLDPSRIVSATELVPNLFRLMTERGAVLGEPDVGPIAASGPNFVSVPGYVEILGGRRATCHANACPPVDARTVLDEGAAMPDASLGDVAVIASWEGIGRAIGRGRKNVVVSVGSHGGETRDCVAVDAREKELLDAGERAGPAPGIDDFRRDEVTASLALHYFDVRHPRFLFVGLGETDEFAHQNNYDGYLTALARADAVIGELGQRLDELERAGQRTLLIVTTDYGRSDAFTDHGAAYPESASVWLVAAGDAIRARGRIRGSEPRRLADISPTIRAILGLPRDSAPGAGTVLHELLLPNPA